MNAAAHQLRHLFGTKLYQTTHDIRLTQAMLGHADAQLADSKTRDPERHRNAVPRMRAGEDRLHF